MRLHDLDLRVHRVALTLVLLTLCYTSGISQSGSSKVQGVVQNTAGEVLPGISVIVRNLRSNFTAGTTTDSLGNFVFERVTPGGPLSFSFSGIGYEDQTLAKYTLRDSITLSLIVKLISTSVSLDQVVVVGYGTQKKISMTGSVGTIRSENLVRRPVSNIQQAMQGQLPGLTVIDNGGAPGKSISTMRVRGITTLGDNNPLVMVDGIEQRFADINPNDIESISVLKDAASSAIYGSRSANGVILITTKKGRAGKLSVSYHGFYALQDGINHPPHMGLEAFMRMMNDNHVNAGMAPKYTEDYIQEYLNATDRYKYPLPNTWFETIYKTAPQQNHSLAISGGSEAVQTRLSIRYQDQQAIVPSSGSKISEIRLNTNFKLSPALKVNTDLNYRYSTFTSLINDNNQYENIYNRMFHSSQWATPRFPDGTYGLSPQGHNPLMYAEIAGISKTADDYIVGNLKADWQIIKGLQFTTQLAARVNLSATKAFANKYEVRDYYNPSIIKKTVPINSLTETRGSVREITLNSFLSYSKSFAAHNLSVLAGYSIIDNKTTNISAFRQNFYNNSIQSLSQGAADNTRNNGGGDLEWGLRSYFGRLNYSYKDKYLFEANSRYDGSSRFMEGNRYGFFPSFSAGWRISKEDFWEPVSEKISELKLRGSWGKTGNQAVDLYTYFPTLNVVNYTFGGAPVAGYTQLNLAVQDLTWETTSQINVGLDAAALQNRLNFSMDFYRKRTEGILLVLPVPATLGLNPSAQNAGIVQNQGWEFKLGTNNKIGNFQLDVMAHFSINDNKVISLAGTGPYIAGTDVDPVFIIKEGLPINGHWGHLTGGLFQTQEEINNYPTRVAGTRPGDVKYLDINDDGIINGNDRTYLGNSFPRYTYGASLNLGYKNFTLNVLLQGAADVDIRLAGALAEMGNNEGFTHAIFTDNYWTPERRDARFPRPIRSDLRNLAPSDRMLIDGSYLRLKNVQLVYRLPSSLVNRAGIENASFYISATNLLTFSKMNEWKLDPETASGRGTVYPQTALYTLGLNLDF